MGCIGLGSLELGLPEIMDVGLKDATSAHGEQAADPPPRDADMVSEFGD